MHLPFVIINLDLKKYFLFSHSISIVCFISSKLFNELTLAKVTNLAYFVFPLSSFSSFLLLSGEQ